MKLPGFIGASYKHDSPNIDAQRCINWYPEINESRYSKDQQVASLIPTPGFETLANLNEGPIRYSHVATNGKQYVVSADKLYLINSDWSAIELGTLLTSTGNVDMKDNGTTLVIVDGPNGYTHTINSRVMNLITDPAWEGSTRVNYVDGYFIFNKPDSGKWYISGINSTDLDALDFASTDGLPDNLISTQINHREVWLFGDKSIETWYNSGNPAFPFQRVPGGFSEIGCAAAFSIAKIDKNTLWLGKTEHGTGIVFLATGLQPRRISTNTVEQAIQSYGDISDANAWVYQQGGHSFYVLNFTNANTTWTYDLSTGLWHERAYFSKGAYQRHRANCHSFINGIHVVGDYENGKLYKLDSNINSDDGEEIKRERISPHTSKDSKRIQYNSFQLDVEAGVGLDGNTQGSDPQVILKYSDDGGHSWSNEKWRSLGKIGQKAKRIIWRKLGASRDRIFSISTTDPVKVTLISAEIDILKLRD